MAFSREFIREQAKEFEIELPKGFIDAIANEYLTAKKAYADEQIEKAVKPLNDQIADITEKLKNAETQNGENAKYKELYENEKAAYESYKGEITAKETKAAKEKAARDYFKSKGVSDDNMGIAMRGIKSEIDAAELDDKGKIKDTRVFDELIKGDYAKLISRTETRGADTQIPPPNAGGKKVLTWDDIDKIKDDGERQKAMLENMESLGIK